MNDQECEYREREKERSVRTISFDSKACTLHYIVALSLVVKLLLYTEREGRGLFQIIRVISCS